METDSTVSIYSSRISEIVDPRVSDVTELHLYISFSIYWTAGTEIPIKKGEFYSETNPKISP